jgi:hypothetical protein
LILSTRRYPVRSKTITTSMPPVSQTSKTLMRGPMQKSGSDSSSTRSRQRPSATWLSATRSPAPLPVPSKMCRSYLRSGENEDPGTKKAASKPSSIAHTGDWERGLGGRSVSISGSKGRDVGPDVAQICSGRRTCRPSARQVIGKGISALQGRLHVWDSHAKGAMDKGGQGRSGRAAGRVVVAEPF